MIKMLMATCAESVSIDAGTNSMSIFSVIEEVNSPTFPVLVSRFTVLFLVERETKDPSKPEGHFVLRINEVETLNASIAIDFQEKLRSRVVINLQGLVIPAPGTLQAELQIQGKPIGSWSLPVHQKALDVAIAEARAVTRAMS